MASLFDYVRGTRGPVGMDRAPRRNPNVPQHITGPMEPGGYTWRGGRHEPIRKINQLNRNQLHKNRLRNTGSIGGGGRSNLDAQRGFSRQGISGLGGFLTPAGGPIPNNVDVREQYISRGPNEDEKETFSFSDKGLGKNIVEDATRMVTELTPNMKGLGSFKWPSFMLADSIANNQQHHKYINSRLGRASPDKNMAFWNKAIRDANVPTRGEDPTTMMMGDTSKGSSLGQAMKYLERAGITKQDMEKFMNKDSKWYGNEAYLSSMAGADGAEDFATGMSFIKNAKSSANLARNMAAQEQAQLNQGMSPDDYYETGEHWRDTSGDVAAIGPDYEIGEHWNIDDTPFGLTETEDITADYNPYPDEKWDAPLDHPYAGIYDFERQRPKSTFTPKLYDEDRTHSTLPLGPRRITSEPGQVTYPFGPNLLDPYYGIDLASDVALGNRGYGTGPDEIFEEDEVYFPNNPKSRILGG